MMSQRLPRNVENLTLPNTSRRNNSRDLKSNKIQSKIKVFQTFINIVNTKKLTSI